MAQNPFDSYLRFFHAIPGGPVVDIYANNSLIARDVNYGGISAYLALQHGKYQITVFAAGTTVAPVADVFLMIPAHTALTTALVGSVGAVQLKPLIDAPEQRNRRRSMVRFVHLSPTALVTDFALNDGRVLFRKVAPHEATRYASLHPGRCGFKIRIAGSRQIVFRVPDIRLGVGQFYTVYLIGYSGGDQPVQTIVVNDLIRLEG